MIQNILLNRGNDLTEFFWPIIYYVKESIFKFHQIPLWNNLFFCGTPLFQDPQNPSYYLPNIIFLFTSINNGFIISLVLHAILGAVGMYLAARSFNLNKISSIFAAVSFAVSPKLMGYLEAGHFGLITSWAWLPLVVFAINKFFQSKNYRWSILAGISLAAIFYTHILTFLIFLTAAVIYCLILVSENKNFKQNIIFGLLTGTICFLLIAPVLIPQLAWQKDTTRSLLLNAPDVYPKWQSKFEFIKSLFQINLENEKVITVGVPTLFLAALGFLRMRKKHQIIIFLSVLTLILVSLNNASPLYNLLIKQNWYVLLRVATRVWFVVVLISLFLAAFGLEKLLKGHRFLAVAISSLAIMELLFIDFLIISKPIPPQDFAPKQVYEFLAQDKDIFRVFCLNRCLSQKEAVVYGLELADGYGTLQQKNYYAYSQQLAQAFFRNRYSLSIPPFEIYKYEKLQPYAPALAAYRIKYVISDHRLTDKDLMLAKTVDKYLVYQNLLYKSPNYTIYEPNFIRVNTLNNKRQDLTIPETYNPNWKAYKDGVYTTKVSETSEGLRQVEIDKNTSFVDFRYQPSPKRINEIVALLLVVFLASFLFRKNKVLFLLISSAFALRILFLSPFLEDWDSVQFAMALHHFDISQNLPHAPGYPIYILLGKFLYFFVQNDTLSLTLLSTIAGSLAIIPLYLLAKEMFDEKVAFLSSVIYIISPVSWMMAESALTNIPGLFSLLIFVYLLYKHGRKHLAWVSLLGGFILGARATELPVIATLLFITILKNFSLKKMLFSLAAFLTGISLWLVPVVAINSLRGVVSAYSWIADYVIHHDSLINTTTPFANRLASLAYLLKISYTPFFFIFAVLTMPILLVKGKSFRLSFLLLWFLSYFIPLIFFFNLEVPRYTLPLLPPLAIAAAAFMFSFKGKVKYLLFVLFLPICLAMFLQGWSQAQRFHTAVPPTVAVTDYVNNNFSQQNTIILASYTFRQFEYYSSQFKSFYSSLPQDSDIKNVKFIVTDYLGLIDKSSTVGNNFQIVNTKEFKGDRDINTRIPSVTLYTLKRTN